MSWLTEKLTSLLSERGLAAEAVARQLGLERSRMNNILSGAAIPNENLVKRLAAFFGEEPELWVNQADKRDDAAKLPATVPDGFFKVATIDEILDGEMKIVFNDLVAVANAGGGYHAFGNVCPHAAGPIGDGFLDGCIVECPWHAGQWDIRTGKALTLLATADIPCFEVRVSGQDVEVKLTAAVLAQGTVSDTPS